MCLRKPKFSMQGKRLISFPRLLKLCEICQTEGWKEPSCSLVVLLVENWRFQTCPRGKLYRFLTDIWQVNLRLLLRLTLSMFLKTGAPNQPLEFEQLPFGQPLYILYSSGTSGKPKCIVHSAGVKIHQSYLFCASESNLSFVQGVLINTKKGIRLGYNMTSDDTYFQYTTVSSRYYRPIQPDRTKISFRRPGGWCGLSCWQVSPLVPD